MLRPGVYGPGAVPVGLYKTGYVQMNWMYYASTLLDQSDNDIWAPLSWQYLLLATTPDGTTYEVADSLYGSNAARAAVAVVMAAVAAAKPLLWL